MAGRNFWVAIGALGTLLGGATAVISVMRQGPAAQSTSPIEAGSAPPTYSEAIWCAAEAGHVGIAVDWLRARGISTPANVQEALPAMTIIAERAEAAAVRAASGQGKDLADVEREIAGAGLGITMSDYGTERPTESIVTDKVAAIAERCRTFSGGEGVGG